MAEVNLSIHGKTYGIACDDGQEGRVAELGKYVDSRLREISMAGAATNESHMLVLAALVLADEIYDLTEVSNQNQQPAQQQQQQQPQQQPQQIVYQGLPQEEEQMILSAIANLTERVEKASDRMSKIA